MSDSAVQSANPPATKSTPNFGSKAPAPMKVGAVDPGLVKDVESVLASREATVDRPTPSASVTAPAAPGEANPKFDQKATRPGPPLTAGSSPAVLDAVGSTLTTTVEKDPKTDRTIASAKVLAQMAGSKQPTPGASPTKPSASIEGSPKPDREPPGGEPPPHPGPNKAKAAGPERVVADGRASPSSAPQRRKTKMDPAPKNVERRWCTSAAIGVVVGGVSPVFVWSPPTMPHKHNTDRRHHIAKMKFKVENWAAYEAGLRRRGSLTLWIQDEALDRWQTRGPGGQARYRDIAIQTSLMLGAAFNLPSWPV